MALSGHCPQCESKSPFVRRLFVFLLSFLFLPSTLFFLFRLFCAWTIISLYISLFFLLLPSNACRIFFSGRWCCFFISMFLSLLSSLILSLVCMRVVASLTVTPFFLVLFSCRSIFPRWFSLMSPVLSKGWSLLRIS